MHTEYSERHSTANTHSPPYIIPNTIVHLLLTVFMVLYDPMEDPSSGTWPITAQKDKLLSQDGRIR